MTEPEELVRSTTRAIASIVRDVPPLRLSAAADAASFAPRARRARRVPVRRRGWLAPAAAAAVVLAVAVSLVIIRDISNGPVVPAASSSARPSVPEFYVTLAPQRSSSARDLRPNDLVIGDTLIGKGPTTLRLPPPKGSSFFGVTAAADDRTFLVDTLPVGDLSDPTGARTWYLLRLAPGTSTPARLTKLAIPRLANVTAIALSGSGTELAVATGSGDGALGFVGTIGGVFPPILPGVLRLYSVSTGTLVRAWSTRQESVFGTGPGLTSENNTDLTWVDDDRAIAFFSLWTTPKPSSKPRKYVDHESIRVLDVTAHGGELLADSRVTWSQTQPASSGGRSAGCQFGQDVLVVAEGKAVVCPAITDPSGQYRKGNHWTVRWLAYSATAPTVARTLDTVTVAESFPSGLGWDAVPISAPSIEIIAVWYLAENNHPVADMRVGLISQGRFTPLPVRFAVNPDYGFPAVAW